MRRNNFLTAALVALLTFVSLSAFVGRRGGTWRSGWRYNRCYYDNRERSFDRDGNSNQNPEGQPVRDSIPIQ